MEQHDLTRPSDNVECYCKYCKEVTPHVQASILGTKDHNYVCCCCIMKNGFSEHQKEFDEVANQQLKDAVLRAAEIAERKREGGDECE